MNCLERGGLGREGKGKLSMNRLNKESPAIDCFEHLFSRASLLDKDTLAVQMAKSFENVMC